MSMLSTVLATLLAVCAAVVIWLITDRRHLRAQGETLAESLTQREAQNQSLAEENRKLGQDIAVARETQRGLEKQFAQIQAKSEETFKALAGDVLRQFSDEHRKQADVQLESRKREIDALLKPIRESLDQHQKAVTDIEKQREGAYHGLRQQLTTLLDDQRLLRQQTATLSNALRRSDVRGRWGEITLRRIAEMAGMVAHCDFCEQVTIWKGDERQRPDMVVNLPSERVIVVDAKGVGNSYLEAIEAGEEGRRGELMQQHLRDIEGRVRELSLKGYQEQMKRSPDFVVLFIPGESFLHPAAELRPDLIEWALSCRVVIATPTTLISLLKVIELGWREERIAESAAKISATGRELHKRLNTLCGHLAGLGTTLGRSVEHYNKLVGSFESQVLVQARRFEDLRVESSKKLPAEGELPVLEALPRVVQVGE